MTNLDTKNFSSKRLKVYKSILPKILRLILDNKHLNLQSFIIGLFRGQIRDHRGLQPLKSLEEEMFEPWYKQPEEKQRKSLFR